MADQSKRRRRNYSKAFKRRVVAETLEPGASVAAVARLHGVRTEGYGNNVVPGMGWFNEWHGPQVFDKFDSQMRERIARERGTGL